MKTRPSTPLGLNDTPSALVLVALLFSCGPVKFHADAGPSLEAPVIKMIGNEGGSIVSSDGHFTVTFPTGALSSTYPISLEAIAPQVPGNLGHAWRVGPSALSISTSITMTFEATEAELAGSTAEALVLSTREDDGSYFVHSTTVDTATRRASLTTKTLGDVEPLLLLKLEPGVGKLHEGERQALKLTECGPTDTDFAADCRAPRTELVSSWTVDGSPGNQTRGLIEPSGANASYRAPLMVSNDHATVGVKVFSTRLGKTIDLSSRINLFAGPPSYFGPFTMQVGGSAASTTLSGRIRFVRQLVEGDTEQFFATDGTVTSLVESPPACMPLRPYTIDVSGSRLYVTPSKNEYRVVFSISVSGLCGTTTRELFGPACKQLGLSACSSSCAESEASQLEPQQTGSIEKLLGSDLQSCGPQTSGTWTLERQ